MTGSGTQHPTGRGRRFLTKVLPASLVVLLVAGAALSWQQGWAQQWWDDLHGEGGSADPAAVAAPAGVHAPDVVRPAALAKAADESRRPVQAAIRSAMADDLSDRHLGKHVLAAVAPLGGGGITYRYGSSAPGLALPASTTKLVTSTVALFLLGAQHTFSTKTVLERGGTPRVVLVGGGDPFLSSTPQQSAPGATITPHHADVQTLAARTAQALRKQGTRTVRVGFDDSLFSGPAVNPTWRRSYIPEGVVSPISALWVDEGNSPTGYGNVRDPAATAGQVFASALRARGIKVVGEPMRTVAGSGATALGSVTSAPLSQIVQRILEVSDNEGAEILLRHVGLADQGEGSFLAGQRAVKRVLGANGVAMQGSVLYDGSGLSRHDRMAPGLLIDVLRLAARDDRPELRPVLEGLPVAGFNGSLASRMDHESPAGRGRVRAKTGTLTGVTSLAGLAVDLDGDPMVFVLMADRVPKNQDLLARVAMDDAAASLGACHCGS